MGEGMTKEKKTGSKKAKKPVEKGIKTKTKTKSNIKPVTKTKKQKPKSRKEVGRFNEEDVLIAIKGCRTIVSTVAKRLHCDWTTAYKYINRWDSTKQAYNDEKQISLDLAESALFQNVDNGDVGAIKYFLTKKAKERGYGDEENGTEDNENTNDNVFRIVDTSPLRACDTGEFDDE